MPAAAGIRGASDAAASTSKGCCGADSEASKECAQCTALQQEVGRLRQELSVTRALLMLGNIGDGPKPPKTAEGTSNSNSKNSGEGDKSDAGNTNQTLQKQQQELALLKVLQRIRVLRQQNSTLRGDVLYMAQELNATRHWVVQTLSSALRAFSREQAKAQHQMAKLGSLKRHGCGSLGVAPHSGHEYLRENLAAAANLKPAAAAGSSSLGSGAARSHSRSADKSTSGSSDRVPGAGAVAPKSVEARERDRRSAAQSAIEKLAGRAAGSSRRGT